MSAELHPWNTAFEWRMPPGRASTLTSEQLRSFDEHGFLVIDDLVDQPTLERAIEVADAAEAAIEAELRELEDGRLMISEADAITFSTHLVATSQVMKEVALGAQIASIAADLVGPDVNLYWDQAVYKKPEKPRRFPWHQDNGYTYVEPQQYLTVWLALTDATIENGCPWIAPGTHRAGTLAHHYVDPLGFECFETHADAVAAPVKAGGGVVFSSLTPHYTGPNASQSVRKAYILQYAPVGAEVLLGDPSNGPPGGRTLCDDPSRQFPVVRGGRPV